MRKKTFEEVKQVVLEQGKGDYIVKPPYVNSKINMEFIHKTCGTHFMMRYNAFQNGQRCPKCSLECGTSSRTKTQEQFIKEVDDCYGKGGYTILGKYKTAMTKVKVRHNKCGNVYLAKPADFIRGHGCPKCAYKVRSSKIGFNQRTSFKKVCADINRLMGDDYEVMEPVEGYKGNRQKLTIKHLKCGNTFSARYCDIQRNLRQCSWCTKTRVSFGEAIIYNYLVNNLGLDVNKDFYYGYTGFNLYDEHRLHFDFYIPKLRLAIEYDGVHHYRPINYFGGIKNYNMVVKHDKLKDLFCKDNNIRLLRLSYLDNSKDKIINKLSNNLCGFKE